MKILLILLLLSSNAFAALTVGNVPKVKTGGSAPSMQDSNITENSGNVGIGTTTPQAIFHGFTGVSDFRFSSGAASVTPTISVINTSASGKAAALVAGTSGSSFNFDTAGYFVIQGDSKTNFINNNLGSGSTFFTVQSGGNVGIGSLVPGQKVDIAGTTDTNKLRLTNTSLSVGSGANVGSIEFNSADSSGPGVMASIRAKTADGNFGGDGEIRFATYSGGALTDRVVINTGGNVGIGTMQAVAKLILADGGIVPTISSPSGIVVSDTSGSSDSGVISLISGASGFSTVNFGDTADDNAGYIQYSHAQDAMDIGTGTGNRMTITSTGNVGIGTTLPTQVLAVGLNKFLVQSDGDIDLVNGSIYSNTSNVSMDFLPNASSGTAQKFFRLGSGTTSTASSGSVRIVTTEPVINQSGTAGYTALNVSVTETATGSGDKNLISADTGGTNRFIVQSAGNVGIGSASPSQVLDVNGAIRSSSSGISSFSGNVGFGTTNPTAQLVVGGNGHILSQGSSAPSVSSCGTGATVTTGSTDVVGEITVGTGTITSCTVTFVSAWDRAPHCFIQGNTTNNKTYALANTTTTFVITSGSAFDSEVLDYLCIGN